MLIIHDKPVTCLGQLIDDRKRIYNCIHIIILSHFLLIFNNKFSIL